MKRRTRKKQDSRIDHNILQNLKNMKGWHGYWSYTAKMILEIQERKKIQDMRVSG